MRQKPDSTHPRHLLLAALALLLTSAAQSSAQSTDVGSPTPVGSNEIRGRIAPRDLGDARLTRHFYTFTGTEGDLLITAESTNFNGDVDIFTANTLRPLVKLTLISGSAATRATKSIYLRGEEPLILRVEGRAFGEVDAQYRIRLEGSFIPARGASAQPEEFPSLTETADAAPRKGRRATSTGARIEEPIVVPPAAPETAAEPAPSVEPPAEPARRASGRRGTRPSTRTGARRNRPAAREPAATEDAAAVKPAGEDAAEAAKSPEERGAAEPSATGNARARPSRTRNTRRGRNTAREGQAAENNSETAAGAPGSAPEAAPEPSTRLVIVTKGGETIERDMKTVRRVTVERGQIVVTGTDGKVTRQPLAGVVKMSIEP